MLATRYPLLATVGAYLGAILCALWLLLLVCAGATDLRAELHELGLD
jgi:hypothetical protein